MKLDNAVAERDDEPGTVAIVISLLALAAGPLSLTIIGDGRVVFLPSWPWAIAAFGLSFVATSAIVSAGFRRYLSGQSALERRVTIALISLAFAVVWCITLRPLGVRWADQPTSRNATLIMVESTIGSRGKYSCYAFLTIQFSDDPFRDGFCSDRLSMMRPPLGPVELELTEGWSGKRVMVIRPR